MRLHYGVFGLLAVLMLLGVPIQLLFGHWLDAVLQLAVGGLAGYTWWRRRQKADAAKK